MKEKFLENIKEALEIDGRDIQLSDTFRDYEEWDSLSQLSLIAMLDEEYEVEIEDEEFASLKTLEDILGKVNEGKSG